MANLDSRIDSFQHSYRALAQEALEDEDTRKKMLKVAMEGFSSLESPVEAIWRIIMSPHPCASLMTILRMGLLPHIVQSDGQPITAERLAELSGSDKLLIVRLMRPLTALGIFKETDVETYTSTPISQTLLLTPPLLSGYQVMYSAATVALAHMPSYLEKTGFKNVSGSPGPFEDAHNFPAGFFPWLISQPEMMNNFDVFMSAQRQNRKDWYELFPVDEILFDAPDSPLDSDPTLLIDVGGGEGHDIAAFHAKFPNASGKLVLQDIPQVINNIKHLDPTITRMGYDFFTEQPVRDARAYYFSGVFHDWPDAKCVEIMKRTAAAMKKGYSKMLIYEFVIPDRNSPLYPALLDIKMMALLSGMERTKTQWVGILEAAGLEVCRFWSITDENEALIEAQLK